MNKFLFKSSDPDLQKMYVSKFEIINKNLLYLTYQTDKILKLVHELQTNNGLQKQVDDYFDQSEDTPEHEDKEPD